MKSFNDLKISTKLVCGFLIVLGLSITLGVFSIIRMAELNQATNEIVSQNIKGIQYSSDMNTRFADARRYVLGHTILRDEENRKRYESEISKGLAECDKDAKAYEALITEDEDRRNFAEYQRASANYQVIQQRIFELSRAGKQQEAQDLYMGESRQAFGVAKAALERLVAWNDKDAAKNSAAAEKTYRMSRMWTIGVLLAVVTIGFVLAFFISRLIGNPLREAAQRIKAAEADGDLRVQLEVRSHDEVGQICAGFNSFIHKLHEAVSMVAGSAEQVASASEEISSSATEMAHSAETQESQTVQVATAMQEMSSTILQVSDNCNKAAENARKTADAARQGGHVVQETVATMRSIAQSSSATAQKIEELGRNSDQIGQIVGVIDDIADQTNLLALNAAIEAARAGEQGRGFAVVADEVRKLAERTTKATKEIAQMIKTIQEETHNAVQAMQAGTRQVDQGVASTEKAGTSLDEIIKAAEQVGDMITHIATAATQQSSATEEVNGNMEQIAKLIRESASGSQQAAQACQDLSNLALDLQNMVSRFKVSHERQPQQRAAASPRTGHGFSGKMLGAATAHSGPVNGHGSPRKQELAAAVQ